MSNPISQRQSDAQFDAANSIFERDGAAAQPAHKAAHLLKKVPEITIFFWIIKLLTTAMGETTSDYMVNHIDPVIAVAIGALGLCVALALQLVVRRYIPAVYWFAVVMVAIFGTMAADVLHIGLGIPYLASTIFFAIALAIIFGVWYATEKTLSIHSIYTLRRELFYWATIVTTFALGTALGDMTATTLHLGYLDSGILFAVLFALPGLACWLLGLNEILAFWFAYIVTRPLGASFADWMGKPRDAGGIGFGTGTVSLVLTILIIALVAYVTITRKDIDLKQQ
ncbi:membrane protein [Dictyobacter sp. S3.2.2.5]|uniref:Membrane protein n=1 Tax=Dictyobacter halimunensis TaxID=3026934 RepID=A0ABQ6FZN7_9CHLR|nr:membrane protein [Dictyobacter sp. S3.2.2.5]